MIQCDIEKRDNYYFNIALCLHSYEKANVHYKKSIRYGNDVELYFMFNSAE